MFTDSSASGFVSFAVWLLNATQLYDAVTAAQSYVGNSDQTVSDLQDD